MMTKVKKKSKNEKEVDCLREMATDIVRWYKDFTLYGFSVHEIILQSSISTIKPHPLSIYLSIDASIVWMDKKQHIQYLNWISIIMAVLMVYFLISRYIFSFFFYFFSCIFHCSWITICVCVCVFDHWT